VLSFGQYLAGPMAAAHLAEQGAEVTQIDPPTGPRMKEACTGALRALTKPENILRIDLRTKDGQSSAEKLIKSSDIIIENFRPGVMDSLGLSWGRCKALNPRLIYLSMPGFSPEDHDMNCTRAWEAVIAASSGVYIDMGINRQLSGAKASYTSLPLASAYASVLGALSVTLAMLKRDTFFGDHITVPLASALHDCLRHNSVHIGDEKEDQKKPPTRPRYETSRSLALRAMEASRKATGVALPPLSYSEIQDLLDPFYATYVCADGRPYYLVAPSHPRHQLRLLGTLGLLDAAIALRILEKTIDQNYCNNSM